MAEEENNPAAEEESQVSQLQSTAGFSMGDDVDLDSIEDVPVEVTVVLGETTVTIDQLLKMGEGAIVELDKKIGENVDLYVNEHCVARGEIIIVDNKIGVTMTEVIRNDKD